MPRPAAGALPGLVLMGERVGFVERGGTRLLLMDLSGLRDPAAALPVIAEARRLVAGEPPNSVLTLVDVTGAASGEEVIEAFRELAAHNRPYVIAGAVVGLRGLQRVVYQAVLLFSGRTNLRAFHTREQAEQWLASL